MRKPKPNSHNRPQRKRTAATGTPAPILQPLEPRQFLAAFTWSGGALGNSYWNDPANWVGNAAPTPGSDLIFSGTSRPTNVNNFPAGTTFNSISFTRGGFQLLGNPITLTAGIPPRARETGTLTAANFVHLNFTLAADQTFDSIGNPLVIEADIHTAGHTLTFAGATGKAVRGVIGGSGALHKSGSGFLDLTAANTYSGGTTVAAGSLSLDPAAAAGPDATSAGTGPLYVAPGALLNAWGNVRTGPLQVDGVLNPDPDFSIPGLFTGDLTLNGRLLISRTEPVELSVAGAVTLGPDSVLELNVPAPSVATRGTVFTIIDNDGADPIAGTFAGLPEGATFAQSFAYFTISYVGGDGNDVTLTVGAHIHVWDGGGQTLLWSDPANWRDDLAPTPGSVLDFSDTPARPFNDFPAGTIFERIIIGSGHHLEGNPISLLRGIGYSRGVIDLEVTLLADQTFEAEYPGLQITRPLHLGPYMLTLAGHADIRIDAPIDGAGGLAVAVVDHDDYPPPVVYLSAANTYTGPTNVLLGELRLDGPASSTGAGAVTISDGASLRGDGRAGPVVVNHGGVLRPGFDDQPGVLTLGDFLSRPGLQLAIRGPAASGAGVSYDRLVVNGTVSLENFAGNVQFAGFGRIEGVYTLIDNDGVDPVDRDPESLPEGALFWRTLSSGQQLQFRVSYAGGDGNDLTLTPVHATWIGAASGSDWSNQATWLGGILPGDGYNILFQGPSGSSGLHEARNDIADLLTYSTLRFAKSFSLSGNPIALARGITSSIGVDAFLHLDLLLAANQDWTIGRELRMTGNLHTAGNTLTLAGAAAYTFGGAITGGGSIEKYFGGSLTFEPGTTLDGWVSIHDNARLSGSATITGPVNTGGGSIDPIGILRTGGLDIISLGSLTLHVGGPAASGPGESYDQVAVTGAVYLGDANLNLQFQGLGDFTGVYTLIDNDGADPIAGTFDNAPEGHIVTHTDAGGQTQHFRLSYVGGDGNDLTLTRLMPGAFQFAHASYAVDEQDETVTITVHRVGGDWGALPVEWGIGALFGAVPGEDFLASSGILNFADGQTSASFNIQIYDDSLFEDDESLTLTLGGTNITLGDPSTTTVTIAASDIPPATITGQVFRDAARNGTFDAGVDAGLLQMTVFLDADNDALLDDGERTVLTAPDGSYTFDGLTAANYTVRHVLPIGWRRTGPDVHTVTLTPGQLAAGHYFPVTDTAAIRGYVFHDVDSDGVLDPAIDPPLAGRRVFIDANNNALFDPGEISRRAAADGRYTFEGLAPGVFRVRAVLPDGWRASGGSAHAFTLAPGTAVHAKPLLQTQRAAILGVAFHDANANQRWDAGELALAGWRVFIDANNDRLFTPGEPETFTDSAGNWSFKTLTPGAYILRMSKPKGWTYTTPTTGSHTFTVTSGQIVPKAIFSLRKIT